mmetsp:Transcript_14066/g.27412  ORF Transcript_14066/g.27412 Transcript_14066/m.27412 type:complete len:196 (-) Transcript_14066:124-711(-)
MGGGAKSNDDKTSSPPLPSFLKSVGGDDCDRPACDDTKSALTAALGRISSPSSSLSDRNNEAKRTVKSSKRGNSVVPEGYDSCPPSKDVIGSSTWSLLHSMAAWYPNKPTEEDKQFMTHFMTALAKFYPCTWCAKDFQENIALSPPRTESREDLCTWLCEQHNIVNSKLGKPNFQCSMKNLDERWRKSSNSKCKQ